MATCVRRTVSLAGKMRCVAICRNKAGVELSRTLVKCPKPKKKRKRK